MNRILIVEDEKAIADMVRLCLVKNGYLCDTASDGGEAAEKAEKNHYDLVLLDVMLPDIDGYELIDYIKQFDIPVIFVTAKSAVNDRIKGLRLGADDYITKPFDLGELTARIETVLRRYHKTERELEIGRIKIDTLSRTVLSDREPVFLPAKEYDLLLFLISTNSPYFRTLHASCGLVWEKLVVSSFALYRATSVSPGSIVAAVSPCAMR